MGKRDKSMRGETLKKFFSCEGKFNIFYSIGLILIILNFFYRSYLVGPIGLSIGYVPEAKNGINHYKKTGKIKSSLIGAIVIFIITVYIIISTMLGI